MEYTKKLAEFCAKITIDDLSEDIIRKTKLCLLDYVANIHGSLQLDAVARVIFYVKSLGISGGTPALGCGFKTNLHYGAFINGTTAEAIEAQDGVRFGGNHPGAVVMPAALALAEDLDLGGKGVIEAVVAGYEAATRPAAPMHPWHTLAGFLPTGTCGVFGAAAAASRLKGYDTDGMLNTFGIAGYLVPMSMADPRDPMTAADLARKVRQFAGERDQDRISDMMDKILAAGVHS
jgi:2-methylcitrate dehydratase PrpD